MKKQPEVREKTRQRLIDAFWELYTEKPIDKITVKEISLKSGHNRSTFYEYFLDVYDVLAQIEQSLIPTLEDLPPPNFAVLHNDPMAVGTFVQLFEKHSKYYTVLLGDKGDPAFQSKLKNSIKPMIRQLICENGMQDDMLLDYLLEYMLSAMIGVLSYWFSQENRPPSEDLVRLMYTLSTSNPIGNLNIK